MTDKNIGRLILVCAACLISFGCGPKLPYEVVEFSGTMTYRGKPVPNVSFFFEPVEGRPSSGSTDADGKFTMYYTKDVDGVQVGKGCFYFISVPQVGGLAGAGSENAEIVARLPQLYPRGNDKLVIEVTKKEKNYELVIPDKAE